MKWISSAIVLILWQNTFAANGLINGTDAEVINKKSYQLELEARSWSSSTRVDADGEEVEFDEDEGFSKLEADLLFRYGFSEQLELRGGALFRQVKSTDLEATKSGAESVRIGAKYAFKPLGNWQYAVDLQYSATLYENTDYTTASEIPEGEMILGDAGNSYHVMGILSYKSRTGNSLNGSFAYVGAPNSLSSELFYDVNAKLAWKSFALFAGLEGVKSLKNDPYTDEPENKPPQGLGESYLYNSVNRSYTKPYVGAYKSFGRVRVGIRGAQVISGISTDKGTEVALNLAWNSRGETRADRKLSKFKEYDLEASVIKVSPRGKFLKIDKGISQDVEKGQLFDIYKTDYFGGNDLVAQGRVYELGADWAIIKLAKKFKKMTIKSGFTARGLSN
ncbi:hypothetical protein BIY24_07760 [Halobacteriovorax marinus]|uniref:hypothetical protein n=1 Tax=Halobacteriovorax marinus TaxID=97084 RepID=UPI000BC35B26|nr:hypothetical protein [Halobacteriovorax marinus]ATH07848.1 hypothetical protein BIY24_07760 [Halobacteriovorax marinus]